jgi:hypothetical protein
MVESRTSCGRGASWDDGLENMIAFIVEESNIFTENISDNLVLGFVRQIVYKNIKLLAASRWQFFAGNCKLERFYFFGPFLSF